MNEKDIINYAVRGEMPDLEQMRAKCKQGESPATRRFRLPKAAVIAAALLVFAMAGATAATIYIERLQRLETGSGALLVVMSDEEYEDFWARPHRNHSFHTLYVRYGEIGRTPIPIGFYAATAQHLNTLLERWVFDSNGEPFELMAPIPGSHLYHADDRGYNLYNSDGEVIGAIYFSTMADGTPILPQIFTVEENYVYVNLFDFSFDNTLEDVIRALGENVRFPDMAAITDEYTMRINVMDVTGTGIWEETGNSSAFMTFFLNDASFSLDIRPQIERTWIQRPVRGDILVHTIAGTTVHEVTNNGYNNFFTWQHGGLVYQLDSLFLSTELSFEIIRGMIE